MDGIAVLVEAVEVAAVVMAVWEAKIEEDSFCLIGKCLLMAVACTTIVWAALAVEVWECAALVVAAHQMNRTIIEAVKAVNMIVAANFRLALDIIEVLFHRTVAVAVAAMEAVAMVAINTHQAVAHIIEKATRQVQCKYSESMKDTIIQRKPSQTINTLQDICRLPMCTVNGCNEAKIYAV